MTERHIVMFSGGIGSWGAARRVVERVGRAAVTLLFTDTRMEDDDLYRFLDEAAADVGAPLVKIADGRTPWEVFHDEKLLGDSRFDPCSKILKRRMSERWLKAHCDPAETTLYLGIDWTEEHRFDDGAGRGARYRYARLGWRCEAPMLEPPYLTKTAMLDWLKRQGIRPPRLYELGFAHNNCGGFCIKAGHGHFAHLLRTLPERYAYHEAKETEFRETRGWRHAILRDRRGGQSKPLPLRALRERIEGGEKPDRFDIGGCGCFLDDEPDAA